MAVEEFSSSQNCIVCDKYPQKHRNQEGGGANTISQHCKWEVNDEFKENGHVL